MAEKELSLMLVDIQQRLLALGKSQVDMEAGSGVPQSVISRTMNGQSPSLENYESLLAYVLMEEEKSGKKSVGRPRMMALPVIDMGKSGAADKTKAIGKAVRK